MKKLSKQELYELRRRISELQPFADRYRYKKNKFYLIFPHDATIEEIEEKMKSLATPEYLEWKELSEKLHEALFNGENKEDILIWKELDIPLHIKIRLTDFGLETVGDILLYQADELKEILALHEEYSDYSYSREDALLSSTTFFGSSSFDCLERALMELGFQIS